MFGFHGYMSAPYMARVKRAATAVVQVVQQATGGWLLDSLWTVETDDEEKEFRSLKQAVTYYKKIKKVGVIKYEGKPLSAIKLQGKSALRAAVRAAPSRLKIIEKLITELTERRNREDEDLLLLTLTL